MTLADHLSRVQRKRTAGWKMPEGAVYVGRPSQWGNPFPVKGEWATWAAVAIGGHADADGKHAAAVEFYRAWMTGTPPRIPTESDGDGGEIEYTNGEVRKVRDIAVGMALWMLSTLPPTEVGPKPDPTPLKDKTLVCWCPLDKPCHADVLAELVGDDPR